MLHTLLSALSGLINSPIFDERSEGSQELNVTVVSPTHVVLLDSAGEHLDELRTALSLTNRLNLRLPASLKR